MKKLCSLISLLLLSSIANAQNVDWANLIGGTPGNHYHDAGAKVSCLDAFGHIYVTGIDGLLKKIDVEGNDVWSVNTGKDGCSIAADIFGYIYITGVSSNEVFIEKRDSSGSLIWTKMFDGANKGIDIKVDDDANVYATGHFTDSTDFDPDINTHFEDTGGAYILKLDSAGSFQWVYTETDPFTNFVYYNAIALDNARNVYVGYFSGHSSFQHGSVKRINADGTFGWIHDYQSPTPLGQLVSGIEVTDSGYVYVSGVMDVKPGMNPGPQFVHKMDTAGNHVWLKTFNATVSFIWDGGIDVDNDGNVYVIAAADGSMTSFGFPFMHLAKLNPNGDELWSFEHFMPMGSPDESHGYNIAVDDQCNLYLTGTKSGNIDLDPGGGTFYLNGFGIFVERISCDWLNVKEGYKSVVTINIYPNPSTGVINISSSSIIRNVQITDVLGRVVYTTTGNSKTDKLDVNSASGLYYITLTTDDGVITQKVVMEQ